MRKLTSLVGRNDFFQLLLLMIGMLAVLMRIYIAEASTYKFVSTVQTNSTSTALVNQTVLVNVTSTTTNGYLTISYSFEQDSLSWLLVLDSSLQNPANASEIYIRYLRIVHSNLQKLYRNELFYPSLANYTIDLNNNSSLSNNANGMTINPAKMLHSLGGVTNGKLSRGAGEQLDIPEFFAGAYNLQIFVLKLNTSQLLDNSSGIITVVPNGMIAVNMTLFKGKNPQFDLSVLQLVRSALSVVNVTTQAISNYCSASSPVVAFAWNSWKLWFTLFVVLAMLTALTLNLFRPYYCVLVALAVFFLSGVLTFTQATSGFSNEGLISETFLFAIVYPLGRNTFTRKLINLMFGSPKYGYWLCILRICIVCTIISAFINDTPIVITLIPLIKNWARQYDLPPSKFLMPMNIATIAGGLLTLIGTSTNVIASGLLSAYGYTAFTFYEFVYIGAILAIISTIYLTTLGSLLLPNKKGGMFRFAKERGEQFLCKLEIKKDSPLIGKTKKKVLEYLEQKNLDIVEVIRRKQTIPPPSSVSNTKSTSIANDSQVDLVPPTKVDLKAEDFEYIVPVGSDFILNVGDFAIFKGPPNVILTLHSNLEIEEQENIIQSMLGTDAITEAVKEQIVSNNEEKTIELVQQPPIDHEVIEVVQQPQNETEQFVEAKIETIETPVSLEGSNNLPNLIQNPIPKATLIQKIEEQGITVKPVTESEEIISTDNTFKSNDRPESSSTSQPERKSKKDKEKEEEERQRKIQENQPEFFEVVISSSNTCIGQSYYSFRKLYGVSIVAIRHREWIETKTDTSDLDKLTVKTGDTLLILGKTLFYDKYREAKDFYVISRCNVETPEGFKFIVTIPYFKKKINLWWWEHLVFPVFFAMVGCAIAGYNLGECTMVAFIVEIFLGLMSPTQAVECIEWPIIILIGASLGVGNAITASGIGEALSTILKLAQLPNYLLPACIILITILITSVITNNAAVAICMPLAIAVAQSNNLNPRCFAMAATIASSTTFILPIGYQCNLLIMNPGGYSTLDFVKLGLPLTILYFFAESIFIPLIWGLQTPNF